VPAQVRQTMRDHRKTHRRVQTVEGFQASCYGVNTCDNSEASLACCAKADGFHRHRSLEQLIEVQLREDRI